MVGTGVGATRGILIRSGEALETLHSVDVVIFDKTGTITEGKMQLADIITNSSDEAQLLSLLSALESLSDHPIARAITDATELRSNIISYSVNNFENINGMGLKGDIEDFGVVIAGNRRMMLENCIDMAEYSELSTVYASEGKTLIFVAVAGKLIGFVTVCDTIKCSAKQAISALKELNVRPILLTGDNVSVARAIADEVGIYEVHAEILPIGKADIVNAVREQGKCVMMVGDGINDAPALTSADIGVAIGNGSDIAIDSAQVVLMRDDPADVYRAVKLGKYTIRNIKQNLFWAFCYNVLAIPIAAGLLYPI
jgi:Cu+-exporting ATPase